MARDIVDIELELSYHVKTLLDNGYPLDMIKDKVRDAITDPDKLELTLGVIDMTHALWKMESVHELLQMKW